MINSLCAVHDNKAEVWSTEVYSFPGDRAAVREFVDTLANASNSPLSKHPADFDLYRVGYYDLETGEITKCVPEVLYFGRMFNANPQE